MFFNTIASLIPPPNTHPHGHTATQPYQVPHCCIIQGVDAGLAIAAVASRRKSAWRISSSTRQQRVSHDGSSVRYRSHAANNGCACCSFGGSRLRATPRTSLWRFRLSPKPPTRWDDGSSSRSSRRKREAHSCQPISTAVQQYSLTPTASTKSTKTTKSTRLTIRRTRRIQPKKCPVEKGRFRLAESDCVRNSLGIFLYNRSACCYHTQLAKMSFDKIFDLTAGVFFYFYKITAVCVNCLPNSLFLRHGQNTQCPS